MGYFRFLAAAALLSCATAQADFVLSTADVRGAAGAPLALDLTILNSGDEPLVVELPAAVHARFETATGVRSASR